MKGKLKNGFKFEISDNISDDWEFVKLFRKAQQDSFYFVDLIVKMLGEEQEEKLCDSLRREDGIVHTEDIAAAIEQMSAVIEKSGNAGKN